MSSVVSEGVSFAGSKADRSYSSPGYVKEILTNRENWTDLQDPVLEWLEVEEMEDGGDIGEEGWMSIVDWAIDKAIVESVCVCVCVCDIEGARVVVAVGKYVLCECEFEKREG